jgi:hypothetical protein
VITDAELRKKALRPWSNGHFLRCWLDGQNIFPLEIHFKTPSGRKLSHDFRSVRAWIAGLKENSATVKGYGYTIFCKSINHRQLGPQQIPDYIFFKTKETWLKFIAKKKDFNDFRHLTKETRRRLPELMAFLAQKPLTALEHQADWSRLITVCKWFSKHPKPDIYLRQLDIAGIDTKFIESRKRILAALLEWVLDDSQINRAVTGLSQNGFERRFGLKYDPPLVRLRILDQGLAVRGLMDLSLPMADAAKFEFGAKTIFITENKINGLSFPPVKGALIIFGLGYGIKMLSNIAWLKKTAIYYWGDIDTHGFAILSRRRGYFPQTRSLFMDQKTFFRHRSLWGNEPKAKRFSGDLTHLTQAETLLFNGLKANQWGPCLRLEQEHLSYSMLLEVLKRF